MGDKSYPDLMEDVLKFLLVAAVLVMAFIRQVRKEAQKKAPQQPAVPLPDEASPLPHPEKEDHTYGGYIPQGPAPEPKPAPRPRPMLNLEGQRTTRTRQPEKSDKAPSLQEKAGDEDFRIQSVEEARRAIIWGEILSRKY